MKTLIVILFASIISLQIQKISLGNCSEAFGGPGLPGNWSSARKIQVGTFYDQNHINTSPLWFTLAEGILTEIFYPTIDRGQLKDSQILISDGHSFVHQEKTILHHTEVLSPSLVRVTNEDIAHRYRISHTYFTLKDSATLIDEVVIQTSVDGLNFYLLTKPQLNNSAAGDSAVVTTNGFFFGEGNTKLSVNSSVNFRKKSVGFVGYSDGFQDLGTDFKMDYAFDTATNGSVASLGEFDVPAKIGTYKIYIIYSFGEPARLKLFNDYSIGKNDYSNAWDGYLSTLNVPVNLTPAQTLLYYRSLYTLKCHEDKFNPGAFIASLSVPWGESQVETPGTEIGGYHLIWPRDLFNVSVALLNSGDYPSALAALRFLKRTQYKSDAGTWDLHPRIIRKEGAWPQNMWVTGKTYWEGLQIDQTAFPIHLFYHIYLRTSPSARPALLAEFKPMLNLALNFISTYGPWTHQERWEENFGISPSSFSAAASALLIGSKIFTNSDYGRHLELTANNWLYAPNNNIDSWTYTTTGVFGNGQYYLRMAGGSRYDAPWNPNDNSTMHISNSTQRMNQNKIIDQGFLQLALLGIKPADSPLIKNSKAVVDQNISYMTPKGRGWYRYSYDAYGEDGRGRLWPLLSGEHARYAIERYSARDLNWNQVLSETTPILNSFLGFANSGLMIPEQVFEANGEGTGSATPLAWSHAEYIKLLWSLESKHNIENVLR